MISRVFKILFFTLISVTAYSQYRIDGKLFSREDTTDVKECTVHLNGGNKVAVADKNGKFVFTDIAAGEYILHFTSPDFEYQQTTVTLTDGNQNLTIYLEPRRKILSEVTVTDANGDFGFTRMRSVENMGIYEGKKSEVIIPEQLVANLSTNNARQVYSRVAGLNIWDNDGGGLQLSIGGRGLDPNRTSNFNTRQNGYDISADALGYPESYYTPPVEAIGKIQIVRGAASLQYGTQFGGLINFIMKTPVENKKLELTARQTGGSFGFYNTFTSASGTINKLSYYTFFQFKRGDGWRKNSHFNNHTFYANLNYKLNDNTNIKFDVTQMGYLAQQPGGLSDFKFAENPKQTNRERNWFKVNWNLFALHFDHKFNPSTEINVRFFGLSAYRYSVGFRPYRVDAIDDPEEYTNRDLIKGDFNNWGVEARLLKRYKIGKTNSVLLVGTRFYDGFNHSTQGFGSKGKDADFNFIDAEANVRSDYRFPNRNAAVFVEDIFYITEKLSFTPGMRLEYINTTARGFYRVVPDDLAGNPIDVESIQEHRSNARNVLLGGFGASYKASPHTDVYGNISMNYRSITFNDMRIVNRSSSIDPDLQDEKGFSVDLGIRSEDATDYSYDVSAFYLNYANRIGEIDTYDELDNPGKFRTNVGQALIMGIEAYGEADVLHIFRPALKEWTGVIFNNIALIQSQYSKSEIVKVEGKNVEFVPAINLKNGVRVGYNNLKASFQFTYLSKQYSDATNQGPGDPGAIVGIIPEYAVMDLSLSYQIKKFRVEGSINNVSNKMYFTRRATGYPGPGILPSDGRSLFLTLQVKI
jgi:Fe(3+) dicitrate transport protein